MSVPFLPGFGENAQALHGRERQAALMVVPLELGVPSRSAAGVAAGGCRHADVPGVANRTKAVGPSHPCEDASLTLTKAPDAAPGVRATSIEDVSRRRENRRSEPNTQHARCRRPPVGGPSGRASCPLGNTRSHLAGEQNPHPSSVQFSTRLR
jgi:hypothetical protein